MFPCINILFTFVAVKAKTEQLLLRVRKIFLRCGLRNVTMDDVSREMGISKKTLYQFVTDKNDLVLKTVSREIEQYEERVKELMNQHLNVIDELFAISRFISERFQEIHPSTLFEMQKYYPEAWQVFEAHRLGFIIDTIQANVERGIKEGMYREDINPGLIARLYCEKIDLLVDHSRLSSDIVNPQEFFLETLKYHLRGVCNVAGLQYLEDKLIQMQSSN